MQETTPEYHYLELALATASEIIQDLLPHDIRSDLDELKLKSYILLRHAAVEEYLERASVYALRECLKTFEVSLTLPEPLAAVCIYYEIDILKSLSSPLNKYNITDLFREVCDKAIERHIEALDGVHGIKTKDQNAILNPIGLKLHDFDHVLSQKLNSIGQNRGGIAHQFRIKQLQPRIAVESDTVTLLRLLQTFDNEICRRMALTYHV